MDKSWNRPWSMEEMIENSQNWTLAGDVALLNSIKAFADNMLTKSAAISDNVDDLLNNLNEVSLKLDISQNEFQSLRNTQFIESRVYEDDETLVIKEDVKIEEKEPTEEEKEKMIRESILEGLAVVDKYFDKIEVSVSDSEDESDKSYILQAKDLYADRPLPLIIGTEEWYKKWHVGLAESSSESETENVSETYSVSDSEDDLPKDVLKGSESSSDFSSQTSENRPVANSTFNDSVKKPDIFASDEESDGQGSLPVKTPIFNKSFAEQLAAKLGNVISERDDTAEVNKKPIQPAQNNKFVGDLFSDEPPPLDDLEETILPKSAHSGLFSGGQGLFDDNEDDLFWGHQNKPASTKPEEDKLYKAIKPETLPTGQDTIINASLLPKSSQVSKGLFDSDDSSDEDIFMANKKQLSKQPFLHPYKTTAPLFDEKPPELDTQKTITEVTKKKPIGEVSIFGTSNLFGDEKIENVRNEENITTYQTEESVKQNVLGGSNNEKNFKPTIISLFGDEIDNRVVSPPKKSQLTTKPKKISLFDDDDDLFKDDLFSNITSKKLTSNLFEDERENDLFDTNIKNNNTPKVDLFSDLDNAKDNIQTMLYKNNTEEKLKQKGTDRMKKNLSLFSDNEEEEEEIFGQKPNVSNNKVSTTDVVNNNVVNFDKEKGSNNMNTNISETNESLLQRQVIGAEKRTNKGLFDDDDNENEPDDLFKELSAHKTPNKPDLFENNLITDSDKDTGSTPPKVEVKLESHQPELLVTSPSPKASNVTAKSQEKSVISLFGSSPPPDDDNWDTRSDNFSDNEDQFSFRRDDHSEGLSLFDNEPPSLGLNESSGIVDDYNTRVDTDDSFLHPNATSSRRLSSDIDSGQQSQDSFFITKNKTESTHVTAQLGIIPEDTKISIVDITPSGNLEDLDTSKEYESTADSSSVFDQNQPSKPRKPISLFDDDYKSSLDTDDLFSFTSQGKNLPKLSDKRLSNFHNVNDTLNEKNMKTQEPLAKNDNPRENKTQDVRNEDKSGASREEPPRQVDVKNKVASITGQLQNEFDKEAPKPPSGSPGKLKHNLKINVNALMPGYAPPKLRDMSKSQSLDLPKEQEAIPTNLSTPDVSSSTPDLQNQPTDVSSVHSEKAVSFGDVVDNVEVLHSVTKDRAKIPIKRRPSTRRGRQQAIRKSEADVSQEKDSDVDPTRLDSSDVENKAEKSAKGRETVIGEQLTTETPPESIAPSISLETPNVKDIIDNKDNLFTSISGETSKVNTKSKTSIFDSADSDNDLFSPSEVKKAKTENKTKSKSGNKADLSKKSLFNDSSSDDDLFSTSGGGRKQELVFKAVEKKTQKASIRKLENIETDDDPLSSLLK